MVQGRGDCFDQWSLVWFGQDSLEGRKEPQPVPALALHPSPELPSIAHECKLLPCFEDHGQAVDRGERFAWRGCAHARTHAHPHTT